MAHSSVVQKQNGKIIAIRREDQSVWERRAPFAPQHVKRLVRKGITVLVQPSNRRAYPMQVDIFSMFIWWFWKNENFPMCYQLNSYAVHTLRGQYSLTSNGKRISTKWIAPPKSVSKWLDYTRCLLIAFRICNWTKFSLRNWNIVFVHKVKSLNITFKNKNWHIKALSLWRHLNTKNVKILNWSTSTFWFIDLSNKSLDRYFVVIRICYRIKSFS